MRRERVHVRPCVGRPEYARARSFRWPSAGSIPDPSTGLIPALHRTRWPVPVHPPQPADRGGGDGARRRLGWRHGRSGDPPAPAGFARWAQSQPSGAVPTEGQPSARGRARRRRDRRSGVAPAPPRSSAGAGRERRSGHPADGVCQADRPRRHRLRSRHGGGPRPACHPGPARPELAPDRVAADPAPPARGSARPSRPTRPPPPPPSPRSATPGRRPSSPTPPAGAVRARGAVEHRPPRA